MHLSKSLICGSQQPIDSPGVAGLISLPQDHLGTQNTDASTNQPAPLNGNILFHPALAQLPASALPKSMFAESSEEESLSPIYTNLSSPRSHEAEDAFANTSFHDDDQSGCCYDPGDDDGEAVDDIEEEDSDGEEDNEHELPDFGSDGQDDNSLNDGVADASGNINIPRPFGSPFALYDQQQRYDETEVPDLDDELQVSLGLLTILDGCRAPLYLYDEIRLWAFSSTTKLGYKFEEKPKKRTEIVQALSKRYDLCGYAPKYIPVTLPGSKKEIILPVHSVEQAIYSLLSDPDVVNDETLSFPNDDPFSEPPPNYRKQLRVWRGAHRCRLQNGTQEPGDRSCHRGAFAPGSVL